MSRIHFVKRIHMNDSNQKNNGFVNQIWIHSTGSPILDSNPKLGKKFVQSAKKKLLNQIFFLNEICGRRETPALYPPQ